jgi:hypothetical protein
MTMMNPDRERATSCQRLPCGRVARVSSERFSRPDDGGYLSLTDLHHAVRRRADRAHTRTVESRPLEQRRTAITGNDWP